jgi:hypothetical protein
MRTHASPRWAGAWDLWAMKTTIDFVCRSANSKMPWPLSGRNLSAAGIFHQSGLAIRTTVVPSWLPFSNVLRSTQKTSLPTYLNGASGILPFAEELRSNSSMRAISTETSDPINRPSSLTRLKYPAALTTTDSLG